MSWLTIAAICAMAISATMAYNDGGYEQSYSYESDGYGAVDSGLSGHEDGEVHTSYEPAPYQNDYQQEGYGGYNPRRRRGHGRRRFGAGRRRGGYRRRFGGYDGYGQQQQHQQQDSYGQEDNQLYGEEESYGQQEEGYGYGGYEEQYAPSRRFGRKRMNRFGKSSGTFGYNKGYNKGYNNKYVPVVIKKKKEKKRKIVSSSSGFYIPGGTAVFGKFKDLHSCEKACELTPTCFAGDYNPWLGKCYLHSNISACQSMRAHKQITHFKKIPCSVVETPRGLITLGTSVYGGLEQKSIKSLMDCVKGCATAGGGIAKDPSVIATTPQICFGIDYNFAQHKCYFHTDDELCGGDDDTEAIPVTPVRLVANPSSVNILMCPIAAL